MTTYEEARALLMSLYESGDLSHDQANPILEVLDMQRAHLEAIRDYCDNPAAVGAENMTPAQKVGGMWSQAVAAL